MNDATALICPVCNKEVVIPDDDPSYFCNCCGIAVHDACSNSNDEWGKVCPGCANNAGSAKLRVKVQIKKTVVTTTTVGYVVVPNPDVAEVRGDVHTTTETTTDETIRVL